MFATSPVMKTRPMAKGSVGRIKRFATIERSEAMP